MIEKVNPDHPDKVADRIAGALVDMAYARRDDPRIAVEVLLGHGECDIIAGTSARLSVRDVWNAVWRITGNDEITVRYRECRQDDIGADRCGKAVNPMVYRTGGGDVGCGATNRRLGSDMGDAMAGGGLHGKDLGRADVSVSVYAHLKAQELGEAVEFPCAIGDEKVGGVPYGEIVEAARDYISGLGGFEKLAEWGLF